VITRAEFNKLVVSGKHLAKQTKGDYLVEMIAIARILCVVSPQTHRAHCPALTGLILCGQGINPLSRTMWTPAAAVFPFSPVSLRSPALASCSCSCSV
jgi:hypothetical protein